MFASHYKIDNLTAILDYNNVQLMGNVSEIMEVAPVKEKWSSFGWEVMEIDGHNFKQIVESLYRAKEIKGKPVIIIANTTKGRGVSFMQNTCEWHGNVPTQEEYIKAMAEVKK